MPIRSFRRTLATLSGAVLLAGAATAVSTGTASADTESCRFALNSAAAANTAALATNSPTQAALNDRAVTLHLATAATDCLDQQLSVTTDIASATLSNTLALVQNDLGNRAGAKTFENAVKASIANARAAVG